MATGDPSVVERVVSEVRYVEVADELSQIRIAWPTLEDIVGSMRGRQFVAAFDPVVGWYRACVEVQQHITDAERDLPEMAIPGGRFLRVRLRGEPPGVYEKIAPAYELLVSSAERDNSRPSLERYRRLDQIDVLMPIA